MLLKWLKRHEIDSGAREGVTTEECERIKALEREGICVARCMVERLMRNQTLQGVRRRGKRLQSTQQR